MNYEEFALEARIPASMAGLFTETDFPPQSNHPENYSGRDRLLVMVRQLSAIANYTTRKAGFNPEDDDYYISLWTELYMKLERLADIELDVENPGGYITMALKNCAIDFYRRWKKQEYFQTNLEESELEDMLQNPPAIDPGKTDKMVEDIAAFSDDSTIRHLIRTLANGTPLEAAAHELGLPLDEAQEALDDVQSRYLEVRNEELRKAHRRKLRT